MTDFSSGEGIALLFMMVFIFDVAFSFILIFIHPELFDIYEAAKEKLFNRKGKTKWQQKKKGH